MSDAVAIDAAPDVRADAGAGNDQVHARVRCGRQGRLHLGGEYGKAIRLLAPPKARGDLLAADEVYGESATAKCRIRHKGTGRAAPEGMPARQKGLSVNGRIVEGIARGDLPGFIHKAAAEAGAVVVEPGLQPPEAVHATGIRDVLHVRHAAVRSVVEAGVNRRVEPSRRGEAGEVVDNQHRRRTLADRPPGGKGLRREAAAAVVHRDDAEAVDVTRFHADATGKPAADILAKVEGAVVHLRK